MTYIDLIVATRNRAEKLGRMLDSVPAIAGGKPINIKIIFDGDFKTGEIYEHDPRIAQIFFTPSRVGSVAARNVVTPMSEDAVLMAVDDIEFAPGSIDAAVAAFEERFQDGDGVVGFNQANLPNFSWAGVVLMGQKFLRRYSGKKIYYPAYHHFACQEIEWLAESLGKMHREPAAKLSHFHPGMKAGKMDETHREARTFRTQDLLLSRERTRHNQIWGTA
jgi:hypothetical protein